MSQVVPASRPRRIVLTGIMLLLCGGMVYGLHRSGRADARLLQHAQMLYQSQRYTDRSRLMNTCCSAQPRRRYSSTPGSSVPV
jgi:hypothetical protein